MNTKELLTRARELLSKPGAWCKGNMSLSPNPSYDEHFFSEHSRLWICDPTDSSACRFCAVGAILNISNQSSYLLPSWEVRRAIVELAGNTRNYDESLAIIFDTNDSAATELDDVLKMFDRAIAQAVE